MSILLVSRPSNSLKRLSVRVLINHSLDLGLDTEGMIMQVVYGFSYDEGLRGLFSGAMGALE